MQVTLVEQKPDHDPETRVINLFPHESIWIGRSSKLPMPRLLYPNDPELSSRHALLALKYSTKRQRNSAGPASASASSANQAEGSTPPEKALSLDSMIVKDMKSLNG